MYSGGMETENTRHAQYVDNDVGRRSWDPGILDRGGQENEGADQIADGEQVRIKRADILLIFMSIISLIVITLCLVVE